MKIEIKTEPIPQPRPRFGRGGKVYQPEKIKAYKNVVSYAAKTAMQGKQPIDCPLSVKLKFWPDDSRQARADLGIVIIW